MMKFLAIFMLVLLALAVVFVAFIGIGAAVTSVSFETYFSSIIEKVFAVQIVKL